MLYEHGTLLDTQRSWELVHKQGIRSNEVVAVQNWGVWEGEPRLINYGHETPQFVLDDADQVTLEDYVPEIPESYDDPGTDDDGDMDDEADREETRDEESGCAGRRLGDPE